MECSRIFLFWQSFQLVWDLAYHWGFFYSSFSFSVFLGWRYTYLLIYVKSYLVFLVTHCGETEFTNLVFMDPCIIYNSYRNRQRDTTADQNFSLFRVYIRLSVFWATHRPSSGAQKCTSSLWFCIRGRLLDIVFAGRCPATTTSNNLLGMQNQRLLMQFWAPDDGRCVARNTLSLI
jgi:hypothetical protein